MERQKDKERQIKGYKVIRLLDGDLVEGESKVKPPVAGYLSQKKYGDVNYCPTATRWHKKAIEEVGFSKNLVYFESIEVAVCCGFSPCGNCWIKGENALERWLEYLSLCNKHGIEPTSTPKIIKGLIGS